MLDMVVLIVHNLFVQIAQMVNVVMMRLVYVKLDLVVQHVQKKNVIKSVHQMVENVVMVTVYVQLVLLVFNVRLLFKFAQMVAMVMEFVTKQANNVIVMMGLVA